MLQCITIKTPGQISADTNIDAAWPFPGDWELEEAYFAPGEAVTADGTNYWSVGVSTNDGAGGSFTSAGSFDTDTGGDSVSLAVGTSKEISLSGVGKQIVQGSTIRLVLDETGTGTITGALTVVARKVP